jgi:hypothetical protein
MDQMTDRFPMEPPDPAWEAANPGWQDVAADDPRWHRTKKTESGNLPPTPERKTKPPPPPMTVINPCSLQGLQVPERQWVVQDWMPVGYTTALYGDGGTGKTLLAQQLMTSCATGRPWLGLAAKRCKVFALFCEDDENELHRRQDAINQQYGIDFSDLCGASLGLFASGEAETFAVHF